MKKIFPFHIEGKHPDRLLDHHKHEIKKYMRRETRRPLPSGFDFWDFDCRMGSEEALAEMVHPKEINRKINELKALEHPAFFIELLVKAQKRVPKVRSDLDVLAQESAHEDSIVDESH